MTMTLFGVHLCFREQPSSRLVSFPFTYFIVCWYRFCFLVLICCRVHCADACMVVEWVRGHGCGGGAGFYCPVSGIGVPVACPITAYCPRNSSAPTPCGINSRGYATNRSIAAASSAADCYTPTDSPYRPPAGTSMLSAHT